MRNFLFPVLLAALLTLAGRTAAQSVTNKSWKTYIENPVNDSVILHMYGDSSTVTSLQGDVFLRVRCHVQHDTLRIEDQADDARGCPASVGLYKIKTEENSFSLTLIDDSCEGRVAALTNRKWMEIRK
ncbi:MAG: hypothetical protein U0U70_05490 [Chitinophagaceae bacterium]